LRSEREREVARLELAVKRGESTVIGINGKGSMQRLSTRLLVRRRRRDGTEKLGGG